MSKDDLYESSGVVTAGGRIDVGRSVVGGFMGIGGKEDGGVTVNGAKIVSSKSARECIHEMDDFAHPKVLRIGILINCGSRGRRRSRARSR